MDMLSRLFGAYNPTHVGISLLLCVIGGAIAMRLYGQARRSGAQINWIVTAGVVAGCTVWSAHFVTMLGVRLPVPHTFEPVATITSLAAAVLASVLGIVMAATAASRARLLVGGAVFGGAIPFMHFWGLSGFTMQGWIEWNPALVGLAIVSGTGLGTLALYSGARPGSGFRRLDGVWALIAAFAVTQLVVMAAAVPVPDAGFAAPQAYLINDLLIIGLVSLTIMVLGIGYASYFIDSAGRVETDSHLQHVVMHDMLTGLLNRTGLAARLEEVAPVIAETSEKLVILLLDLDRFKDINEVHGYVAGDDTLKAVAARLTGALGETGFAARLGADEFVAVKLCAEASPGTIRSIATSLAQAVSRPLHLDGATILPRASMGVAVLPDHSDQIANVLSFANLALARAKTTPLQHICVYDPRQDEQGRTGRILALGLGKAIANNEMELHYQPQHRVDDGEIVGFEALLRWRHPVLGSVSPAHFIPIAEETGAIIEIGEWVLNTACRQAMGWPMKLTVAVNISGAQLLRPDFPETVERALRVSGLEPERLELEMTETGLLGDMETALGCIHTIKGLGVSIAMDDFGTGYSSLSTLQSFPFDKIKVDRSFITNASGNAAAAAILRATIVLSEGLGIPVLAEGVESAEDLAFLRETGCSEAQGFYFGRPQPAPKFPERPDEAPASEVGRDMVPERQGQLRAV
jgi:diguanylate cyclase (GGDEF)-like protein